MIENLILTSTPEKIQCKYNIESLQYCNRDPGYSLISAGDKAPLMNSFEFLHDFKFGYNSRSYPDQPGILNIQTELVKPNENENEFDRLWRACESLDFVESFYKKRCVIFVDAFLVSGYNDKLYLIHMNNPSDKPFALAGIYSHWIAPDGKSITGFALYTVSPNSMLKRLGATNMPVIVKPENIGKWIDKSSERRHFIPLIHTYPDDTLNGYEVSNHIFNNPLTKENMAPIGRRLKPTGQ